MYPYITLGSHKIYMMGVGIILAIITFILVVRWYAKKHGLDFYAFLRKLPKYILLTYLLGSYSRYLIERLIVFPLDREYILLYLSPYQYQFHYVGILAGILLSGAWFLKQIPASQRHARIHTFTHALLLSLIPLGIGFVLGDNFIGETTQQGIYISAMKDDSRLAIYDKVIPLGLYVSLFGLASHLLILWWEAATKKTVGYLGIAWMVLGLGLLLLFQQYPRHIVTRRAGLSRDIKQYVSLGVVIWLVILFISRKSSRN